MEHSIYLSGLKKALKAKGITYEELARQLQMTESGVKKMLNAKDISFRRVLQVCDVLKTPPGQLFSLSEETATHEVALTGEQEDALLKSRSLLAVYWGLAIEKRGLDEIQRTQRIPAAELKKLVGRLVALGLLVKRKDQYLPRHGGKFRWADDSKLARTLNREWSALTLQRALEENDEKQALHRLAAMKLSQGSYEKLLASLTEAFDQAAKASEREEVALPKNLLRNFTGLIAVVRKGVFDT